MAEVREITTGAKIEPQGPLSYLRIEGPPNGPYTWSWDKVSPSLVIIVKEWVKQMEDTLFDIIQDEDDDEGKVL